VVYKYYLGKRGGWMSGHFPAQEHVRAIEKMVYMKNDCLLHITHLFAVRFGVYNDHNKNGVSC